MAPIRTGYNRLATTDGFGGNPGWGIANTVTSTIDGHYLGLGTDSVGLFVNAANQVIITINNAVVHTFTTGFTGCAPTDRFAHELDLVNSLYWINDLTTASGW